MEATEKFKQTITAFANYMEWDTSESIEDDFAGFSFELEKGNDVDVSFFLNEDRVDVAVSGNAAAENDDDIPDDFSTLVLRRSDDLMYGAWTLAETEDGTFQYRLLWTVDLDYLAGMASEKLKEVLERLIDEAGEVNNLWDEGPF